MWTHLFKSEKFYFENFELSIVYEMDVPGMAELLAEFGSDVVGNIKSLQDTLIGQKTEIKVMSIFVVKYRKGWLYEVNVELLYD